MTQSQLKITNPNVFRKLFQCLAKFVDRVHFDVHDDGIRIRSIDPHDFCYVDLALRKSFFEGRLPTRKISFGIDVEKLSKILPHLASAEQILMNIDEEALEFEATKKWRMAFRIGYLKEDPYDLPEPKKIFYDASFEIPANEFSEIVNTASSVSNEIDFSLSGDKFQVQAATGNHSFYAEPLGKLRLEEKEPKNISSHAILSYLKTLNPLVSESGRVRIWLGNEKPLKIDLEYSDKGVFSFSLSPKREQIRPKKERRGTSLPRITVTRFPEFLLYLANCPAGENVGMLRMTNLETSGGDYSRLGRMLDFTERIRGKINLTKKGEQFVSLYKENINQAKLFLHRNALSKIKSYKLMIRCLKKKPMPPEDLFVEINSILKKRTGMKVDRQDLSTLLGLATWCGIIDRKLALYYFGKRGERNE